MKEGEAILGAWGLLEELVNKCFKQTLLDQCGLGEIHRKIIEVIVEDFFHKKSQKILQVLEKLEEGSPMKEKAFKNASTCRHIIAHNFYKKRNLPLNQIDKEYRYDAMLRAIKSGMEAIHNIYKSHPELIDEWITDEMARDAPLDYAYTIWRGK